MILILIILVLRILLLTTIPTTMSILIIIRMMTATAARLDLLAPSGGRRESRPGVIRRGPTPNPKTRAISFLKTLFTKEHNRYICYKAKTNKYLKPMI